MKFKLKNILCIVLTALMLLGSCSGSVFALEDYDLSEISDAGIYIVEQNSKEVLVSQNIEERMYPGSITKIMTAMVALDTITDLTEKVTVTDEALSYLGYNSSVAGLEDGEVLTISELIKGTLIPSGNDAAIVLGIYTGSKLTSSSDVGECYDAFIDKMNEKAALLGMNNTHFANADGYDDYDNYSTAYDIVLMGKAALEYDIIKSTVAQSQAVVATNKGEHVWKSTNIFYYKTLSDYYGGGTNPYYLSYVTGMKTGYTDIGQKCFLFTAEEGGMDILGVVLNVDDTDNLRIWRNLYGLLNFITQQHTLTHLVDDEHSYHNIKISNPSFLHTSDFTIYASHDAYGLVYNEYLENYEVRIEYNPEVCSLKENGKIHLNNDIKPMDKVATMVYSSGDTVFCEVDMIATQSYDKFDWFDLVLYILSIGFIFALCAVISRIFKKPKRKKKHARKSI